MSSGDHVVLGLLSMAEWLRTQQPPKFKMAIKCVMSCFKQQMSQQLLAHCKFVYGKLLFLHTESLDAAKEHLESSYHLMMNMGEVFKEARLQALCLICEIAIINNNGRHGMMVFLKNEMENAKQYPAIYTKMVLLIAEICTMESQAESALKVLDLGIQNATHDPYTPLYLKLTKNLVSMRLKGVPWDHEEMAGITQVISALPEDSPYGINLRLFVMSTQLAYWLSRGQAKSAKGLLRRMQSECQAHNSTNTAMPAGFLWCEIDTLMILACVFTVVHSSETCLLDKAAKYYGIATTHLKEKSQKHALRPYEPGVARCIDRMKLVLDEVMAQMHIISARPRAAINNVRNIVETASKSQMLIDDFYPMSHILLGNYCVYFADPVSAEKHFATAVRTIKEGEQLSTVAYLHLALFYLSHCNQSAYYDIADKVMLKNCQDISPIVDSMALMVQAYYCYLYNKHVDFRTHMVKCLEVTKEDILRIHTMCFQLFGAYFPGNPGNVASGVKTLQWTTRTSDHMMLLWTYSQIEAIIRMGHQIEGVNPEEVARNIALSSSALQNSKSEALQETIHKQLVEWFEGDPMSFLPKEVSD